MVPMEIVIASRIIEDVYTSNLIISDLDGTFGRSLRSEVFLMYDLARDTKA